MIEELHRKFGENYRQLSEYEMELLNLQSINKYSNEEMNEIIKVTDERFGNNMYMKMQFLNFIKINPLNKKNVFTSVLKKQ